MTPLTLYVFFFQTIDEVRSALDDLVVAKERMTAVGISVIPRMYNYIEALHRVSHIYNEADPLDQIDVNTLRLLDISLVKGFLADPNDKVTRDALSLQLIMLYAALGLMTDVEPYTTAEMLAILDKKADFYNDEIYAFTLRRVLVGEQFEAIVPIVLTLLANQAKEQEETLFDWYGAVIYTLILQIAWYHFSYLQEADQTLLLKHYFYQAIACGVSVRARLQTAYSGIRASERASLLATLNHVLTGNVEQVPIVFPEHAEPLLELFHQYLAAYGDDPGNAFDQQKFAEQIYRDQPYRDVCASWLREALTTLVYTQQKNL